MRKDKPESDALDKFKGKLAELRKYRPLKANQIADLLGISAGHLTNIHKGRRPVGEITQQRLDEILILERKRRKSGIYLCPELIEIDRELVELSEEDRAEFSSICRTLLTGFKYKNYFSILDCLPKTKQAEVVDFLKFQAAQYTNNTLAKLDNSEREQLAKDLDTR